MEQGNVLVIGNSGVGKSTLINAVLGEEKAPTGWGLTGTTKDLEIYESDNIPFRLIDTIGFEPSLLKRRRAIRAVRRWSAQSAKKGREDTQIHVIWFCVDGSARKLFPDAIANLSRATAMWPSVPVVVCITKSYSVPERAENIEMVNSAFAHQKRYRKNLRKVIPVVASLYLLNDTAYAPPEGLTELIEVTNALMPEGFRAAQDDLAVFALNSKRVMAQSVAAAATTAAAVVGAVPIPVADAMILAPVEMLEVNAISRIYGIEKSDKSKQFFNTIVEVGTVSTAAKTAISALKLVPGLNLGVGALNALVAGSIAAALGEGCAAAFEQLYLGKRTLDDLDWLKTLMESKLTTRAVQLIPQALQKIGTGTDNKEIATVITGLMKEIARPNPKK